MLVISNEKSNHLRMRSVSELWTFDFSGFELDGLVPGTLLVFGEKKLGFWLSQVLSKNRLFGLIPKDIG